MKYIKHSGKSIETNVNEAIDYKILRPEHIALLNSAEEVVENTLTFVKSKGLYKPGALYVGAAAYIGEENTLITASNLPYPDWQTKCAETGIAQKAHDMGTMNIETVALSAFKESDPDKLSPPCGSCRQTFYTMHNYGGNDTLFIIARKDRGAVHLGTVNELLPLGFRSNGVIK